MMLMHQGPTPGNFAETHRQSKLEWLRLAARIDGDAVSNCRGKSNIGPGGDLDVLQISELAGWNQRRYDSVEYGLA